jgi:outer membrane protein assembly factor BamB
MSPPPPAPEGATQPARRLFPPVRVWITLASLTAATALVRYGWLELIAGQVIDQAVRNIITLILAFSGLVSLLIWFLRESGHSPMLKKGVSGGLAAAILLALATLRIERVSGDLVPEFAFRWQASRDTMLPSAAAAARATSQAGSTWTATAGDFPRFLGPNGNASLPDVAIGSDWQTNPPRLVWRQPIGAGWSGFATFGKHAVTLEQRGDDEAITCYSLQTGELEWIVAVPTRHETVLGGVGPRSTPTIREGVVYATGATGWLHAIDGATGTVRWRKDVLADLGIDRAVHAAAVAWGRAGSPLVTDSLVIVPAGGPRQGVAAAADGTAATDPATAAFVSLAAYDRSTGERVWLAGTEQIAYASPQLFSVAGREFVLTVNEAHVAAYNPGTGEAVWQFPWPGHSNSDASCSQPHPLDGNRLFISKGYGVGAAVFAINHSDAGWLIEPVWQQANLLKTKFTNVAIHAGHAYGLSDGILECVRLTDGKRAWKRGRYGQGQVLLVGETLLVQAESGEVVAVPATPERPTELGRLDAIEGQTWNNLCLAGNLLLVRNAEEAACYELLVKRPAEKTEPAPSAGSTE